MVTFAQLRSAQPDKWMAAADALRTEAGKIEGAVKEIHDNGTKPVEEHWADHLGALAKDALVKAASEYTAISILHRGAATALDTLSHVVSTAQRELVSYIGFAQSKGLSVSETGAVSIPAGVPVSGDLERCQQESQRLINEAVEAATQADGLAQGALGELGIDVAALSSDPAKLEETARERQSSAVAKSLNEVRDLLPDGLPPEDVAQWWNTLSPQDQEMFKKAVPLKLYDLPGVPQPVKDPLDDLSRGYSTIGVLRYARDHWNDNSTDHVSPACTDFVSSVLRGGGMPQKGPGWWGSDTEDWYSLEGVPIIGDTSLHRSNTWTYADGNRKFFEKNGAGVYPPEQALPGDVLYWSWADGPNKGESHHAAVVTGVLPDGEVLYTQHEPNAQNYSLQDRKSYVDDHDEQGASIVVAVSPKVTW